MKARKVQNFNGHQKKSITWLSVYWNWLADNGFKPGFIVKLEELMEKKLPKCCIKASPNIESRYKILRRKYQAI